MTRIMQARLTVVKIYFSIVSVKPNTNVVAKARASSFAERFKKHVDEDKDPSVRQLIERARIRGFKYEYLVSMLESIADPNFEKKTRRAARLRIEMFLTKKKLLAFSRRTSKLAADLKEEFSHPLLAGIVKTASVLEFAEHVRTFAEQFKKYPVPRTGKLFSYKAHARHQAKMLLCLALGVPRVFSFADAEKLFTAAYYVQGSSEPTAPRSLEREYKNFLNSLPGKLFMDALLSNTPERPTDA